MLFIKRWLLLFLVIAVVVYYIIENKFLIDESKTKLKETV